MIKRGSYPAIPVQMKLLTSYLALGMGISCVNSNQPKDHNSRVAGRNPVSSTSSAKTPPGGDYTVGDAASIDSFSRWTPRDRALMIVSTDNGIYQTQNPMTPRALPFFKTRPEEAFLTDKKIQIYPQSHELKLRYESLSQKFTGSSCTGELLIPYHPDTKTHHSKIQSLQSRGKFIEPSLGGKGVYPDLVGFASMSRSMFVLNENVSDGLPLLFSIKVGSDTVMGTHQPKKLEGVHWNAAYVNALSEPTSIHELADNQGISLLSDSVGLIYEGDYGVVLRDYSPLVDEKDYFFMPLMAFQEKAFARASASGKVESYMWNLYKPAGMTVYQKNPQILRLIVSSAHMEKLIDELSEEMGKLIAIYYLNGVSSIDLHGQNLLVGIPLKPELQAMIAVRDISDHYVFRYVATKYIQLNHGAIPEPNWCQPLSATQRGQQDFCRQKTQQLVIKGFNDVAEKLSFDFPDTLKRSWKNTREIYEHMISHPDVYRDQINKVRTQWKPVKSNLSAKGLRAVRCLRSTGCLAVRSRAVP